jgi:serine protease Do
MVTCKSQVTISDGSAKDQMSFLDELSAVIEKVSTIVGPAVVRVGGGWRGGSGVVVAGGVVLTNAHNVRTDELSVSFVDGRRADARVAGIDVDGDLAVLAVDTADITPPGWSDVLPGRGAAVFAVAPNESGPRITFGTVSSAAQGFRGPRGRPISGGLEHTAPLAPGSSGSPLVDAAGRIVGINTNRLGSGFYVALPADESLRQRVAALQRGEVIERPRLGVAIAPSAAARQMRRAVGLPERDGVLVRAVEEGSAAQLAGVEEGDLIVEAGSVTLRRADDLYEALARVKPGEALSLRIVRGTAERVAEVRFGQQEAAAGDDAGPVH